jgi:glycosyltransferase involved in cell wall biosynthesis
MSLRVCLAGTFDPEFPRNRLLAELLAGTGFEITRCHVRLWGQREEAIVRRGRLLLTLRALHVYPRLAWKFLTSPRPDVVLVAYPGHFDMPLVARLARWRGARVVFDAYLSLYGTIVEDRALVPPRAPTARIAAWADRSACRLADAVLVDTPQSGTYLAERSGVPGERFRTLWVGAQQAIFRPQPDLRPVAAQVLFYGTFIPLHGVTTIVRAAKLLESEGVTFRIIGSGQETAATDLLVTELLPSNVELLPRIPLSELPGEIARATLCLGIFGTSDKARRVVPNKLFECLAVGRPVLTADTPAVRAAFTQAEVALAPAGDPRALAAEIRALMADDPRREALGRAGHARFLADYSQAALAGLLRRHLELSG